MSGAVRPVWSTSNGARNLTSVTVHTPALAGTSVTLHGSELAGLRTLWSIRAGRHPLDITQLNTARLTTAADTNHWRLLHCIHIPYNIHRL